MLLQCLHVLPKGRCEFAVPHPHDVRLGKPQEDKEGRPSEENMSRWTILFKRSL